MLASHFFFQQQFGRRPFEFHSDFWLNLHHFLYEQALAKHGVEPSSLDEKSAWDKALDYYRHSMVAHDLLNDAHMRSIDTELAEDETLPKLVVNGADAALWETLNSVAAIYRAHWWTTHDQANKAFIETATPLVQRYGPTLMQQLTTVYETPWPKDPIRVDVSEYANWAGLPIRAWIRLGSSPCDHVESRDSSLEMLFHEATHGFVAEDSGRLADQIAASGARTPKDLVHIFIFYTAGELTPSRSEQ